MAKVFISYRRADSAPFTGRIYDRLIQKFGRKNVFKDVDNIPAGVNFAGYIQNALRECAVELVIIGPHWLDDRKPGGERRLDDAGDFVRIEIEMALTLGLTVIPILLEGATMPAPELLPGSLRPLALINGLAVHNDPDFSRDMERVIAALDRAFASRPLASVFGRRSAPTSASPTVPRPATSRSAPSTQVSPRPTPVRPAVKERAPVRPLLTSLRLGPAWRPLVAGLAAVLVVASFGLLLSKGGLSFAPKGAGAPTSTTNSSSTPAATATPPSPSSSQLSWITSGPDGALWFTEPLAGKIGRITTSGAVSEYPIPAFLGRPEGIASGPDGALWFTDLIAAKIGRMNTNGSASEFSVQSGNHPLVITRGPDGALWFTEAVPATSIGRITTSGVITEYPIPSGHSAYGITSGPDGALWFTEDGNYYDVLGRITTSGSVTEYSGYYDTFDITAGSDGALWFSSGDEIGRITTNGVAGNPYYLDLNSVGITGGPDGALWFTAPDEDTVARLTTKGAVAPYSTQHGSRPLRITRGPDGALWFTEPGTKQIGRISTSGAVREYPV